MEPSPLEAGTPSPRRPVRCSGQASLTVQGSRRELRLTSLYVAPTVT
ncbi:MAG: hypothetical protein N3E46_03845 [Gemmataceae bacterium]|jgi:hypothetical protein|nr:hypothetical protein [Gemmataceae bacterium]